MDLTNSAVAPTAPTPVKATDHQIDPRRALVLTEARRHFLAQGFAATRVEPIARDAGISTATLYTFFPGKAELFQAVIEDASDEFSRQMEHILAVDGPARCQLFRFSEAYARFLTDPIVQSIFRLVTAERPRFQNMALHFYERGKDRIGATLVGSISNLSERGELACAHPSRAAGQLMGMIEHPLFFIPLVTGDRTLVQRSHTQIISDAVETFLARYGGPNLARAANDHID